MAIQVAWDNAEQTIIRATFDSPYTWDEYDASSDLICEMVSSVSHPVDMITILNPKIPQPEGNGFPHYRRTMTQMPKNFGLFVSVGLGNPLTRIVLATLSKALRMKTPSAYTGSVEEAYVAIKRFRAQHAADVEIAPSPVAKQ